MLFLAILLAALPSAGILGLLYWMGSYERQPLRLVFRAFVLGATALPLVFFINAVLPGIPVSSWTINSIVVAPIIEESYKFAAFMFAVYWSREHDEPMDAIVFYVACGIGFAVAENFAFIVSGLVTRPTMLTESSDVWLVVAAIRSFPGHALFGAIGGYFAGRSRLVWGGTRALWLGGALVASILVHSMFNMLASVGLVTTMILYLVGLAVFALILSNDALQRSPKNPVSDVLELDERRLKWRADGFKEAGRLVFLAYFIGSLLLIFALSYVTIWILTWTT